MNDDDAPLDAADEAIHQKLAHLRQEHADMDAAITALALAAMPDQLLVVRLKRKKLALRDQIAMLEDQLLPDIIA